MHDDARVLRSVELLAGRRLFGLVEADTNLTVTWRHGPLAAFVTVGRHVADSLLPLIGLDAEIRALQGEGEGVLAIPSVAIKTPGAPPERLDLSVFWHAGARCFLLYIARTQSNSELELQLTRQMRARLMAEADARARANELARINRDLDEFASIVAHDLKAPMRAIRYLAEDLERQLDDRASAGVRATGATLDRIREQTRRMTDMLTALQAYARAGTKSTEASEVDTRQLVSAVVRSLPRPRGMAVDVQGEWPQIVTLVSQLDLVLRNLIENAIKHHDRSDGLILVSAAPVRKTLEISVADDGPGVAPQHHATVFMPFRSLANSEGGGMGLAFVKKTVDAVGGRIDLISDPDQRRGTTFRVAWPLELTEPAAAP